MLGFLLCSCIQETNIKFSQTDKPLRIEVNTVGSENSLENPPYRKHILTVAANKTMVCDSYCVVHGVAINQNFLSVKYSASILIVHFLIKTFILRA